MSVIVVWCVEMKPTRLAGPSEVRAESERKNDWEGRVPAITFFAIISVDLPCGTESHTRFKN